MSDEINQLIERYRTAKNNLTTRTNNHMEKRICIETMVNMNNECDTEPLRILIDNLKNDQKTLIELKEEVDNLATQLDEHLGVLRETMRNSFALFQKIISALSSSYKNSQSAESDKTLINPMCECLYNNCNTNTYLDVEWSNFLEQISRVPKDNDPTPNFCSVEESQKSHINPLENLLGKTNINRILDELFHASN